MGWYVKPSPTLDFMHKLGSDPETLERFKSDPHGTMDAEGLDDEQKAAIISDDHQRITKHLLNRISHD